MQKALHKHSLSYSIVTVAMLLGVAGCNTSSGTGATVATNGEKRISETELRAFCPSIVLREGTAFFSTHEKGGNGDPTRLIQQATLSETTRACQYGDGNITMDVAAAGRIVPGPKFKPGTYTMPIRVAVVQGDAVIYSKLHKQAVSVTNSDSATQFVFTDKAISFPRPTAANVQVFVGFDEGPYNTK